MNHVCTPKRMGEMYFRFRDTHKSTKIVIIAFTFREAYINSYISKHSLSLFTQPIRDRDTHIYIIFSHVYLKPLLLQGGKY